MTEKIITVKIFRFDPSVDEKPYYKSYQVPYFKGMSALNTLDYIYQNIDSTLAYPDHAGCALGICARCHIKVNGKTRLLCQAPIEDNAVVEPTFKSRVVRDLVTHKRA